MIPLKFAIYRKVEDPVEAGSKVTISKSSKYAVSLEVAGSLGPFKGILPVTKLDKSNFVDCF